MIPMSLYDLDNPHSYESNDSKESVLGLVKKQLQALEKKVLGNKPENTKSSSEQDKMRELETQQHQAIDGRFGFDTPERKKIWDTTDPDYEKNKTIRDEWQGFFSDGGSDSDEGDTSQSSQDFLDSNGRINQSMKSEMLLFLANLAEGKGGDGWIASASKDMYTRIMIAKNRYMASMNHYMASMNITPFDNESLQDDYDEKKKSVEESINYDSKIYSNTKTHHSGFGTLQSVPKISGMCSQLARENARSFISGGDIPRGDAFKAGKEKDTRIVTSFNPPGKGQYQQPDNSRRDTPVGDAVLGDTTCNVYDIYTPGTSRYRSGPDRGKIIGHRALAVRLPAYDDNGNQISGQSTLWVLDPQIFIEGYGERDLKPFHLYNAKRPIIKAHGYIGDKGNLYSSEIPPIATPVSSASSDSTQTSN